MQELNSEFSRNVWKCCLLDPQICDVDENEHKINELHTEPTYVSTDPARSWGNNLEKLLIKKSSLHNRHYTMV